VAVEFEKFRSTGLGPRIGKLEGSLLDAEVVFDAPRKQFTAAGILFSRTQVKAASKPQ
jgi:hypothetical protein